MKSFDPNITAELAKEEFIFYMAVRMEFTQTYYYTTLDRAHHYGGKRYTPATIAFGDISYTGGGGVDYVNLKFGNAGLTMSALLLGEDVRGKTVVVSLGMINPTTHAVIEQEEIFQGMVDEWDIQEDSVNIKIVNELIFWRKKPLRTCSVTCPWEFKGTECGYTGAQDWCDQTWDRCEDLVNTLNFGGFRFAAAMVEKQVWWGKVFGGKKR